MSITLSQFDASRLRIVLPYEPEMVALIRTLPGRKWVQQEKVWTLPYAHEAVREFMRCFAKEKIRLSADLPEAWRRELQALLWSEVTSDERVEPELFLEKELQQALELKGYSAKTVRAYCSQVRRFYVYLKQQQAAEPGRQQIQNYSLSLLQRGCSHAHVNQALSAIGFYCKEVLHQVEQVAYVRPKKEAKLPNVLSLEEVKLVLTSLDHAKHRAILYLTYSSGLRVGEVVRLQPADLDPARRTLRVKQGKGRKDRYTLLSEAALAIVMEYVRVAKPARWLFPGQSEGSHLTERTVQKIFAQALQLSGIRKHVTVHSLRHSFATHLLEGGIDIRYIQELLGHQSSRTTEIYTHVSVKDVRRIKSPLDGMGL